VHEEQHHYPGVNQTLSILGERFWIIHGRAAVKDVLNNCTHCKLRKFNPCSQIMAPLKSERTKGTLRAFSYVSIDFGGPFLTKQNNRRAKEKRYLCLISCLETRAVHLELCYSLTSDSFIECFICFVSRRGLPNKIISDNATNFVGAAKELNFF